MGYFSLFLQPFRNISVLQATMLVILISLLIITNMKQPKFKATTPITPLTCPSTVQESQESDIQLLAPNTPTVQTAQTLPKQPKKVLDQPIWIHLKPRSGDTLASLFRRAGLSRKTLYDIIHHNPYAKELASIKLQQELRLLIEHKNLKKLYFPLNAAQELIISQVGASYQTTLKRLPMEKRQEYYNVVIRGSLFSSAKRKQVPFPLLKEMMKIFSSEINFSRDVQNNDYFNILCETFYIKNKKVSTGHILALSYNHKGKLHQAIRYASHDAEADYYTPEGISLKKAFTRYPLKFSHISSTFGPSRMHPMLHYERPHKGVDLAAPIGTPIHAVGSGQISIIGRQHGYGNMIKLIHNQTYSSVYAHMLKFQKGLTKGSRVKQGQIIGYVGQSGLASGPHCHFEFHIHHQPQNPTTISLPRSAPLNRKELMAFKLKANQILANLKLHQNHQLAVNTHTTLH